MSLVRLWLFTPRSGNYPEGGTYDTSVLNTDTGNCTDSHQELKFEDLLAYGSQRGETLQKVSSAQEAFALCSAQRVISPPVSNTTVTTTPTSGCAAGICGPTGGTTTTTNTSAPTGGGSISPGSGGLPGQSLSPGSGGLPGSAPAPTAGAPAPTVLMPSSSFDVAAFLKGPLGLLMIALIIVVAFLGKKV